jgi:hypothetical protein
MLGDLLREGAGTVVVARSDHSEARARVGTPG